MSYATSADFRRALEDRLRDRALSTGTPLVRLRKMVAFDRFLARLLTGDGSGWLLKGGFALQLRFGDRSRTTRDLDLHHSEAPSASWELLQEAAGTDLGDWFEFEVARQVDAPDSADAPGASGALEGFLPPVDRRTRLALGRSRVRLGCGSSLPQSDLVWKSCRRLGSGRLGVDVGGRAAMSSAHACIVPMSCCARSIRPLPGGQEFDCFQGKAYLKPDWP